MRSFSFYQQHLEKVSRSFSFCINHLISPAKEWVALSYLLLRVVDTIEDLNWHDNEAQFNSFELLKLFLIKTPSEKELSAWVCQFPVNISLAEKNLIMDLSFLLEDMKHLPDEIKHELTHTILQMIDGMRYFISQHKLLDRVTFSSLITTNQYCFFVAGIVGKLLSKIITYLIKDYKWTTSLLNQSFHFGLFLQKINLLKDKMNDETAGRYYISSRNSLRASLVINAQHALLYLKNIPVVHGRSYRLFCAWSLFIGLASLKWIDKNWNLQQEQYKIKSKETYYLVKQVSELIDDNHALEKLFNSYLPESNNKIQFNDDYQVQMPGWFHSIYPHEHASIDWLALGMIEKRT
jgi:Squalene/phytoene synthase